MRHLVGLFGMKMLGGSPEGLISARSPSYFAAQKYLTKAFVIS